MQHSAWRFLSLGAVFALVSGSARASTPEDDLTIVKRAVSSPLPSKRSARPEDPSPGRTIDKPQWLKVRVMEKGKTQATVSINLPLSLVRSLGKNWSLGRNRQDEVGGGRCKIHVLDILRALDAGQKLVEIEDEDSSSRIWVE